MKLTALIIVLIANVLATEGTRIIGEPAPGVKVPIDITVKNGYAYVYSGLPNHIQPFYRQSVNLYDFQKQLEARKLLDEDACYIRKFPGSYHHVKYTVNAVKEGRSKVTTQVTEEWNIPGKAIETKDLEMTVGPKIAEFCSGYRVFWVNTNKDVTKMQARMVKRQWSGSLNGGYNKGSGWSGNAKLSYDNNKGVSGNIGGGWSEGKGWTASVGLTIKF